jgi:hypothetical protein
MLLRNLVALRDVRGDMRQAPVLAVGAVTMLLMAGGPAAAATAPRPDPCVKATRDYQRTTAGMRIFVRNGDNTVYACLRSSGRLTRLYAEDGIYTGGRVRSIAGTFAAFQSEATPACKADCPPGVLRRTQTVVVDAVTGRRRVLADASAAVVRLSSAGGVAFLTGSAPTATLWAWDADGRRQLDAGDIAAGSVGLAGSTVRWTAAGTPRTAALKGA